LNTKLNDFKNPLISYLYRLGADITAFDKADEVKLKSTLEQFKGMDIKYSLGEGYLDNLKGFDILFRTPGMRYDIPEILAAKEEGTEVTSEMEVFFVRPQPPRLYTTC